MEIPKIYILSPQPFYSIYDVLDGAENILSLGAAIPWVGMVFGNIKIVMGANLIAMGLLMATTATCLNVLPYIRKRLPTKKELQWRNNLRENGSYFITHGVGNIMAGSLERYALLGSLMWIVRVALRSVMSTKPISLYDWVFQKGLTKILAHKTHDEDTLPAIPKTPVQKTRSFQQLPAVTTPSIPIPPPLPPNESTSDPAVNDVLAVIEQQKLLIDSYKKLHIEMRRSLGNFMQ